MFECYRKYSDIFALLLAFQILYQVWAQAVCGGRSKTVRSLREHTGKTGRLGKLENEENKNDFLKNLGILSDRYRYMLEVPLGCGSQKKSMEGAVPRC